MLFCLGEMENGIPHGKGTATYSIFGTKYEGHFEKGLRNGEGVF